jgi:HSP20 family protein
MTIFKIKNTDNAENLPSFPSLFNSFFDDFISKDLIQKNAFHSNPAVNIIESSDKFIIDVAVPGMNKEDFKIEVEKQVLKISMEKKDERNETDEKFTRREFSYSTFSRSFRLPEIIQSDTISAGYENGILKIQLMKKDEAKISPVKEIKVL